MRDLGGELMNALAALPKPVTEQQVLDTAATLLDVAKTAQFGKWFKGANIAHLLGQLNGA